jgi:1-acyl-sn-glycerol-3-phosphate acyltransferase
MSLISLLSLTAINCALPRLIAQAHESSAPPPEIRGFLRLAYLLDHSYCWFWHRFDREAWAPLPATGPAILIANHTCGIDHMILQASSKRLLGFMIAREYYERKEIHWMCKRIGCIPVDRDGRDFAATRAALRALDQGRVVPIFPEGRIIPSSGRELGEMKPGAAYLALRAQVPVIPAYISGTPCTSEIMDSLLTPSRARVAFGDCIDLTDLPRTRAGDKSAQAEVCRRFLEAFAKLRGRALMSEP